jgi:hypothetical protein
MHLLATVCFLIVMIVFFERGSLDLSNDTSFASSFPNFYSVFTSKVCGQRGDSSNESAHAESQRSVKEARAAAAGNENCMLCCLTRGRTCCFIPALH